MRFSAAVAATALLAALVYGAVFGWWFDAEVIDADSFVDSASESLMVERSRIAVGQVIVDRMVAEYPLLVVFESNLVVLFSELLATDALEEVTTIVATDIHDRTVSGDQSAVIINLADHRAVIIEPLEAVAPRLADLVPDDWFVSIEILEAGALPDLSVYARWMGALKVIATVGAVILVGAVLWRAHQLSTALVLIGISVSLAGVATALVVPGARWITLRGIDSESVEAVVTNTYNTFTNQLLWSAGILMVAGVSVAVLGAALWAGERDATTRGANSAV